MRHSILYGIALCAAGSVMAGAASPIGGKSPGLASADSSLSAPKKSSDGGTIEKAVAPFPNPEMEGEVAPDKESDEDEEGVDCDECLLADALQAPISHAVAMPAEYREFGSAGTGNGQDPIGTL